MFERFTDRARRSLVDAQVEAQKLNHNFLGTEHLLLGLMHGEGIASKALAAAGFELEGVRSQIGTLIGASGAPPTKGAPPFTPRTKKVLELSLREALTLGHNYIGTEHLLLGLMREGQGVGAQIIAAKMPLLEMRMRVIDLLNGMGIASDPTTELSSRFVDRVVDKVRRNLGRTTGATGMASLLDDEPEYTMGAEAVVAKAEQLAADDPVGTQHLLLSMLDEPDSLAARTLVSYGITREALVERFTEFGTEGTTDHVTPAEAYSVETTDQGLTIRIDDPVLAEKVRSGEVTFTFVRQDRQTPADDLVSGTDSGAAPEDPAAT